MSIPEPAALLQFLAPGFLHSLGNGLFSIQGHAQLLRSERSELEASQRLILDSCKRAGRSLDLLRLLTERRGDPEGRVVGALLQDAEDVLRVALRDAGLQLALAELPAEAAMLRVEGRAVMRALASLCYGICAHLPTGYAGRLELQLFSGRPTEHLRLQLQLRPDNRQLPFQVDLSPVQYSVPRCAQILAVELVDPRSCVLHCAQLPPGLENPPQPDGG